MLTRDNFRETALCLYDYCEYPAVRYKILFHLLDAPYEDDELTRLRPDFLKSDIVDELYQTQDLVGGGSCSQKTIPPKISFLVQ